MTQQLISRGLTLACAGLLAAVSAGAQVQFTEVAASAGVQFTQASETVIPIGGGAVWADFNNDGSDDLYAVQANGCSRLFRNVGGGQFVEVPDAAGADACGDIKHGATAADYDNDGDQDLYVTVFGQGRLFRNELIPGGAMAFTDVTAFAGMTDTVQGNSSSASWGDFDQDGFLDLVVVKHALYMPIDDNACKPDLVYLNNQDGTFTEVGAALGVANAGITGKPTCGLATMWSDYDGDNDVDLMVVPDFGEVNVMNKLYRNDGPDGLGGWIFTDVSRRTAFDYPMFGMGICNADLNGDGRFEYYMSDIGPNNLALNVGGVFSEVAAYAGVLSDMRGVYGGNGLVSWGCAFADLNGDGRPDLIVANGGSPDEIWPGMFGGDYEDLNPVHVYAYAGSLKFNEVHETVGVTVENFWKSIAISDYDGDGDVDFHAGTLQGNNALFRNDTPLTYNWLKVKAVGNVAQGSNRDAIGAKVMIEVNGVRQLREVSGGSGFLSRGSLVQQFGTGSRNLIDRVRVTFPSGQVVEQFSVPANQMLTIVEP